MEQFERLLGKDNPILESIKIRGFEAPSEIQEKTIPEILEGKDVVAGASTGSGKTLAFASGLINNVKKNFGVQGLVLTPTRELAEQVTNELQHFSKSKNLRIISVYGGVSIHNQIRNLSTAEIVVGTPGRILDHLNRNTINLSRINTLVLDEADRMLDMGFIDDVKRIVLNCNKQRQTLLFSATISEEVFHLAQKYMNNPIEISAEQYVDSEKLEQSYYDVQDNMKYSLLVHLLRQDKSGVIMIFCNTRKNVDFVTNNLYKIGINTLPIHGGFSQEKRNRMLEKFHAKQVNILVATDVAARGLDIKDVTHIYNFDIPLTKNEYIHRIGRTARAGQNGIVVNLVASRDYKNFDSIMTEEFDIKREETPYIKQERIAWIPERRNFNSRRTFGSRRNFGNRNFSRNRRR